MSKHTLMALFAAAALTLAGAASANQPAPATQPAAEKAAPKAEADQQKIKEACKNEFKTEAAYENCVKEKSKVGTESKPEGKQGKL